MSVIVKRIVDAVVRWADHAQIVRKYQVTRKSVCPGCKAEMAHSFEVTAK